MAKSVKTHWCRSCIQRLAGSDATASEETTMTYRWIMDALMDIYTFMLPHHNNLNTAPRQFQLTLVDV